MNSIIFPKWKPVGHIEEGWNILTQEEKEEVDKRVNSLFTGNFIKMKTNPIFYLHVFSFLAQIEVLAIQIPLKFMTKFDEKVNNQLRRQLIDEIVHGLIFTKMAYHLSLPLSQPVPIIEAAERMCDEIRNIKDEKLALISLNLIAEGWIEEVFKCVRKWGFSDEIFESILSDEVRHVSDAELYSKTGIDTLNKAEILKCIRSMENNLIEALSSSTVIRSFIEVGSVDLYYEMKMSLLTKHKKQLEEINIEPSEKWLLYEKTSPDIIFNLKMRDSSIEEIESTFMKNSFCKVWESPKDPVITCEFDLEIPNTLDDKNITICYIYFCAKLMQQDNYRKNIILANNHKILKINTVNLATRVLVKTHDGNEIGTVNLFGVEDMNLDDISIRLLVGMEILSFWKNERIKLDREHPLDKEEDRKTREDFKHSIFSLPTVNSSVPHAITNIGKYGMSRGRTAMTSMNSSESCLGEITVKPKWDEEKKSFVPAKTLPVTLNVDHRILNPHDFDLKRAKKIFDETDWTSIYPENFDEEKYFTIISNTLADLFKKRAFFDKTMTLKNKRKMLETLSMATF